MCSQQLYPFFSTLLLGLSLRLSTAIVLPFTEYLDSAQAVSVSWGFDNNGGPITFELTVNTSGWIGFGFSPNGGMAGSDMIIGGIFPNGTQYFTDRHATGNTEPLVDNKQDYTLLSWAGNGNSTTLRFKRELQTCDSDDLPITDSPIFVIFAYGLDDVIKFHESRQGGKSINLLKYTPKLQATLDKYFDFKAENFTVPAKATFYYCMVLKGPSFSEKNHVIRIEPLIQAGNEDVVHHMVLYACPVGFTTVMNGSCYSNTSVPFYKCMTVVAAWAVGGGVINFPSNAGISFGTSEDPVYYRLEMHYNNPTLTSGRVDNSGLRFYHTNVLRQYDIGTLQAGIRVDSFFVIPPGASSFKAYGLCNTSGFASLLPESSLEINVFGNLLHTHLAGRAVRVGHFRGGKQIGFLGENNNYDFNLQDVNYLGDIVPVKVGDEILVECTYNTENRDKLTLTGLGTTNEMCLAFLLYYPRRSISICQSALNEASLLSSLGAPNVTFAFQSLISKIWNKTDIDDFQTLLQQTPQTVSVFNFSLGNNNQVRMLPKLQPKYVTVCREMPYTTPPASNVGHVFQAITSWILLMPLLTFSM
ncbi:DBH-like monooxygenase protein 2 homolog [Erpetoichthys calabaricus]|uniref:DBH-like monooxygenase protein 2 homolog n=1 Tax=Erpetoichthys calabaricus TaxID=27687 RepID=A0A8C4S9C4_ERPCA|nr:DBH-like monooxygenase protein 2 homolog [Erpetoichthys calabaricus]